MILLSLELRFAIALASLIFIIIPSMIAGISGMIMYRSRDMNTALYSARRAYGSLPWIIVGTVISGLIIFSIGHMVGITLLIPEILMTVIIYRRLFKISEWKGIKDEIDWFKWE